MSEPVLRLDANEGRPALPASALAAFLDPELARRYPDAKPLEAALARRLGIESGRVVATAGADEAIDRAARALAGPGGAVIATEPGFVEYAAAASRSWARYVPIERSPGAPLPLEALAGALGAEARSGSRALLILCSPDNPGGGVVSRAELRELASLGFPVFLDATYADFEPDPGLAEEALDLGNVILSASFSKAWGLAGLRSGWAAAPEGLAREIRRAGPPFSISAAGVAAGLAALEAGDGVIAPFVARVRREREELRALLAGLGALTWPCHGNFASARVSDAAGLAKSLAAAGIMVRTWPDWPGREDLVRITCPGDEREFARLGSALEGAKEFI